MKVIVITKRRNQALIKHRWVMLGGEVGTDKAQVGHVGGMRWALIKHRWEMLGRGGH